MRKPTDLEEEDWLKLVLLAAGPVVVTRWMMEDYQRGALRLSISEDTNGDRRLEVYSWRERLGDKKCFHRIPEHGTLCTYCGKTREQVEAEKRDA